MLLKHSSILKLKPACNLIGFLVELEIWIELFRFCKVKSSYKFSLAVDNVFFQIGKFILYPFLWEISLFLFKLVSKSRMILIL